MNVSKLHHYQRYFSFWSLSGNIHNLVLVSIHRNLFSLLFYKLGNRDWVFACKNFTKFENQVRIQLGYANGASLFHRVTLGTKFSLLLLFDSP